MIPVNPGSGQQRRSILRGHTMATTYESGMQKLNESKATTVGVSFSRKSSDSLPLSQNVTLLPSKTLHENELPRQQGALQQQRIKKFQTSKSINFRSTTLPPQQSSATPPLHLPQHIPLTNEELNEQINSLYDKEGHIIESQAHTTKESIVNNKSHMDNSGKVSLMENSISEVFAEKSRGRRGILQAKIKAMMSLMGKKDSDNPPLPGIKKTVSEGYSLIQDDHEENKQSQQQLTQILNNPLRDVKSGPYDQTQTIQPSASTPIYRQPTLISQMSKQSIHFPIPLNNIQNGGTAQIVAPTPTAGFISSEQILKDFFPNLATNAAKARANASMEKKTELEQKKKRIEKYDQIFMELKNKRKTFSKFAFKSHEKTDNASIRPVLEDLAEGEAIGSMSVIDLWSDKNINKFLGNCRLIKDKLMISKIATIKKQRGFFLDEKKPFLLSRKDELNLINKVYMSEQSRQFSEKYSKSIEKSIQNPIELNKSSLNPQSLHSKKLSEQRIGGPTQGGSTQQQYHMRTHSQPHLQHNQQQSQQQHQQSHHGQRGSMTKLGLLLKKQQITEEENISEGEEEEDAHVMNDDESDGSPISKQQSYYHRKTQSNHSGLGGGFRGENSQSGSVSGTATTLSSQHKKKFPTRVISNSFSTLGGARLHDFKSMTMGGLMKFNSNMIKDLDYMHDQNDKDYAQLISTINSLQDRIVQSKIYNSDGYNPINDEQEEDMHDY